MAIAWIHDSKLPCNCLRNGCQCFQGTLWNTIRNFQEILGPDGFLVWCLKSYPNETFPSDIIPLFKVSVIKFRGFLIWEMCHYVDSAVSKFNFKTTTPWFHTFFWAKISCKLSKSTKLMFMKSKRRRFWERRQTVSLGGRPCSWVPWAPGSRSNVSTETTQNVFHLISGDIS